MAGRTRASPSPEGQTSTSSTALDWTTDWARQQFAVANEGAGVVFRSLQAMRSLQEQAAREATERHVALAEKLRTAATPAEVLELQGELLRASLESATRYWQQVAAATLEMNTELAGCAAHLVDTEDVFGAASAPLLHS
jgi:hypothetical protein